ncbi:MAG: hypothetical protein K2H18_00915 [Muribaculaceae bacterium]|nr:hypothetical protein [Muribaculaceae bacterium]
MKQILQCAIAGIVLCSPLMAMADVICLTSGEEIPAKIVTIGEKEITYKKASNPTGPNYVVSRETVFYIDFDNGQREVLNSMDVQNNTTSANSENAVTDTSLPAGGNNTLTGMVRNSMSGVIVEPKQEKRYFPEFGFMPHVTLGYQGTGCGSGNYEVDWGGFYANIDLNCLFASGTDTAWSVGLGFTWLQGDLAIYSGKKPKNQEWPGFNATYIGLPIGWWYKTEYFMFGATASLDLLIRNTLNGKKAEDTLNLLRCPEKNICRCQSRHSGFRFPFGY